MLTAAARLKSQKKAELLRDPLFSAAFYHYFRRNWQAQEVLGKLQSLGADPELLREWAICSFHSIGRDEAEEKRKRGAEANKLKKAIATYKSAMEFFLSYASSPHHDIPKLKGSAQRAKELCEANKSLARKTSEWLEGAEKRFVYTTKRLGVNWQSSYLFLMKSYIWGLSNWEDTHIFEAITFIVKAGYKSVRYRVPTNLRVLLRRAVRGFERHSRNAEVVEFLRCTAGDPKILYTMFPSLSPRSAQSAPRSPETK